MKRNSLTVFVGVLLLVIFGLLLFTFQVRETEIALVTTFEKPSKYIEEPGFRFKLPPPIQYVHKFDKRVQTFSNDKIDETLTQDSYNLDVQVFVGWRIAKPDVFFSSFPAATVAAAEPALESLIRGAKRTVVGKHPFSNFVSTDKNQLKFDDIEKEMLAAIKPSALSNYGIDIQFLGIKQLKLPESVTQKVFERMIAERQSVIDELKSKGDSDKAKITSGADLVRDTKRAEAEAKATEIRGEADAAAAQSYAVFEQNPALAKFLLELRALESVTRERSTFVLDERTRPFNLMTQPATNLFPNAATNSLPAPTEGKPTVSRNAP